MLGWRCRSAIPVIVDFIGFLAYCELLCASVKQRRKGAYTVASVFMMRQHTMLSTGGWPSDTSIGAASATGVPNPEHPSIMYANAHPIRNTSATGCPEDRLRTLAIIQGKHCTCHQPGWPMAHGIGYCTVSHVEQ